MKPPLLQAFNLMIAATDIHDPLPTTPGLSVTVI